MASAFLGSVIILKMKKKAQPKTANDWLAEIMRQTTGANNDPVPKGWLTETEMRELAGVGHTTMHNRITKLMRDRKLQRKKFTVMIAGRKTACWHYFPTT